MNNRLTEITAQDWKAILSALRLKLKCPSVQGSDREALDWRRNLRDMIRSVKQKNYDEINDSDWTEIYYALESTGDAKALLKKIGPDGRRMWTGPGVDRSTAPSTPTTPTGPAVVTVDLDASELATVLAALRYYQENGQGDPGNRSDHIHAIATGNDDLISLDDDAIDILCEQINCAEVQP